MERGGRCKLASTGRSSRVAARLQQAMMAGNFYEAHQTIRVLYQRYTVQGREKDALDLLRKGATFLLQREQVRY